MKTAWNDKVHGFTLTEMIVVMAIITIMASVAIPAFMSMDALNQSDLRQSATELQRLLHAARVYAGTHRVDTAVVYGLDNYGTADFTQTAIMDSVTNDFVRVIDSIAVYREDKSRGLFIPVADKEGKFKNFPGDMVIHLSRPVGPLAYEHRYWGTDRRYRVGTEGVDFIDDTWKVGMIYIPLLPEEIDVNGDLVIDVLDTTPFPAHVFKPSGSLTHPQRGDYPLVPTANWFEKERVTLFIGPSPNASLEERLYRTDHMELKLPDNSSNLQGREIELFHATGRAKVVGD